MPPLRCPQCGLPLTAELLARASCPRCSALLKETELAPVVAVVEPVPVEETDITSIARKVRRLMRRAEVIGWTTARAGLGLALAGLLLLLVSFVPLFIATVAFDPRRLVHAQETRPQELLFIEALAVVFLVGLLLVAAGLWLTGAVPRVGARRWAWALRGLLTTHAILLMWSVVEEMPLLGPSAAGSPVSWANLALVLMEAVCFVAFLGTVGAHFGDEPSYGRTVGLAAVSAVLVLVLGFFLLGPRADAGSGQVRMVWLLLVLASVMLLCVWFLVLTRAARREITRGILAREEKPRPGPS